MSQYPPDPNYNPYGQNPSDPNYNQGTVYGGPPSGPGPNSNPYNPYQNTAPAPDTNPGPYGPYGQNPPTPAPPPYNPPSGPNYNQYGTIPPVPNAPSTPPRRGPSMRVILIAAIALVLVLGGIAFGFISYNNAQQSNANATATAANSTATARANQTATAHAIETATANANATATALVTSQYPPFTTLALNDPLNANSASGWNTVSACQFTPTGYQVSISQTGYYEACFAANTNFTDFAYQVNMTINQGDCGGLVVRAVDNQNYYTFDVCQNGQYNFNLYVKNANAGSTKSTASSAIKTGLKQVNTLAVVVQGDTYNLYVNGQHVNTFTDSTFTHGFIGVLSYDVTSPTVVDYDHALVWTS
jgi:hypothetical protein